MYVTKNPLSIYRTNNGHRKHDDIAVGDNVVVFGQCRPRDQNENAKAADVCEAPHRAADTDPTVDTIIQPDLAHNVTDVPDHDIASDPIHTNEASDANAPRSSQCHPVVNSPCTNQSLLSPTDTNATTSSDNPTTDTIAPTILPNPSTPLQCNASADGDCAQNVAWPQPPSCSPSTFARCFWTCSKPNLAT